MKNLPKPVTAPISPSISESVRGEVVIDRDKKKVLPNAAFAVLQVLVSSAILFFLYRFLLLSLGIDALGVWSLVIASTSLANVSNLGLTGGTVRFVSKYLALDDMRSAGNAVETAILSIGLIMAIALLLMWFVINLVLELIIPVMWIDQARQIVPFALVALWLNSVGGAIHSALDGCHRVDLRSASTIATQPLLLLFAIWLVPEMGLKGIAYAQMFQYLAWLALGWFLLRKQLTDLPKFPWRWSRPLFQEMWRYGVNFQFITIVTLLTEPLAKGLLSYYGNLSAVGYFEMANRLVGQVRSIIISGNQVLVPYYSKVGETSRDAIKTLYTQNLKAIILIAGLAFSSLVALLPLISQFWIGRLEPQFLLFALMLSGGWLVNTLAGPAYFANLGLGRLTPNLIGHATIMVAMVPLAVIGGILAGPAGSAAAWPLSLVVGTCVIGGSFHIKEDIPTAAWLNLFSIKLIALAAVTGSTGIISYLLLSNYANPTGASLFSLISLLLSWTAYLVVIIRGGAYPEIFVRVRQFLF